MNVERARTDQKGLGRSDYSTWLRRLDAEIPVPEPAIGVELGGRALPRHAPALDDRVAVGELRPGARRTCRSPGSSDPAACSACEAAPDLLAHQRREALGRLVEDEQVRDSSSARGRWRASAARRRRAGCPCCRARSASAGNTPNTRSSVQGSRAPLRLSGEGDQVLAHRQVGKDLPALRHERDPHARDSVRRPALDALAAERDRSRRAPGSGPGSSARSSSCPCRCARAASRTSPARISSEMPNSTWLAP